jgi:hypothetical protein
VKEEGGSRVEVGKEESGGWRRGFVEGVLC